MTNLVVAHFLDGRLVKGTSLDVDPNKPSCHIRSAELGMLEVQLAELKALYFVKDLKGNRLYQESKKTDPADIRVRGSKVIQLKFSDGELMVGLTHHYPPTRPFFFVLPIDTKSNNIRVLVNKAAVKEYLPGKA